MTVLGQSRRRYGGGPAPAFLMATVLLAALVFSLSSTSAVAGAAAWATNTAVSLALIILSLVLAIRTWRNDSRLVMTGTFVLSSLNFLAVSVPSASLIWRSREATVERLLGRELATADAMSSALTLFTACLIAFAIGESLLTRIARKPTLTVDLEFFAPTKTLANVLLGIGLLANLNAVSAGVGEGFNTRGEATGVGLMSMASWALAIGIALSVLHSHWGSRGRFAISAAGALLLLAAGVRSPLVLIATAAIPRIIVYLATHRHPIRTWLCALAGTDLFIAVGTGLNLWRGSIRHGTPGNLSGFIFEAAMNPFSAMTRSGTDTVDGLLFVQALPDDAIDTSPLDLIKAVTYLVPRQLYPGKPPLISNELSAEYLHFGTSGMFLSGPGYLILIGGGAMAALVGFLVLGAGYARLASFRGTGLLWLLVTYTAIRFFMGGEAYDFFKGFQLGLTCLLALAIAAIVPTKQTTNRSVRPGTRAKRDRLLT